MKHWPFKVISDSTKPKVQVEFKGETKQFFAEEISSMVLVKMRETAEAFLGKVGCPPRAMVDAPIACRRSRTPW